MQKTAENPQLQFINKVVFLLFVVQRLFPMICLFTQTIEIPLLPYTRLSICLLYTSPSPRD